MYYIIRLKNGYISKITEPNNGYASVSIDISLNRDKALKFKRKEGLYNADFFNGDLIKVTKTKLEMIQRNLPIKFHKIINDN